MRTFTRIATIVAVLASVLAATVVTAPPAGANPAIATTASANVALGAGPLTDSATVSGRVNPVAGATIDFRLYGLGDTTCAGPPVFQSLNVPYPLGGGAVTSAAFTPTAPGTYRWRAFYSGDANNTAVAGACNDANETVVVASANPTIATTASGAIALGGGQLTDSATVSGRANPQAGATVTFSLYGPADTTCTGAVIFSSPVAYPAAAGPVTSAAFTPTAAGTYRWRAAYSGDANNNPVAGACNDANESVVVSPAAPTIATTASGTVGLGGMLTDAATVSGRVNPQAGATISFRLYGPNDSTCSGSPVFQSLSVPYPVVGGAVTSAAFAPTATGTYRWIASYSGDPNNAAATGGCNDANESVVVSQALPSIASTASAGIVLGAGTITDTAVVSGRVNPQAGASVAFSLYGPDDATCANGAIFTSTGVYPVAGGPVTSAAFTPTGAGTYRWIASYGGDVNNASVSGACNDVNESVAVSLAGTVIATTASAGIVLGTGTLTDTAVVSGRANPVAGANVSFRLYGPNDAACSAAPVFQSLNVAYPAAGGAVTSAAFTPSTAGTYRWIATYSGDANNPAVLGACNAANETVVVARATPTLAVAATPPSVPVGTALRATTTLAGGLSPTGSITFSLYGPASPTCTGTPVFTSVKPVTGTGSVASDANTPTGPGTYRWVAVYSGDTNNAAVVSAYAAAAQTVTSAQAATSASKYWLTAADGGVFAFGGAGFFGSMGGIPLNKPVVGIAPTQSGKGYWLVASDGGVFAFGDAAFFGSTGGVPLARPIVGMTATPTANGYWLVAADGGLFAFGDAGLLGSTSAMTLAKPMVGMTATPTGKGYWLVAADGGLFAFGDAAFFGSTGAIKLARPMVGMAATVGGKGYWLVASDGGIFAFGDAAFYGSTGGTVLAKPAVGMAGTSTGKGYWLVASDGGIFAFGDAVFSGSTGSISLRAPVVAMTRAP